VVVVIAPKDRWYEKSFSNLEEVRARGARLVGIGFEDDTRLREMCGAGWIGLPSVDEKLTPFLSGLAVQALSYEIACLKGTDVDQPRNLAKSVTVE
jgi:glucosamine--fructose-6-phosphate aminotransferase (isomerizing)